MNALRSLIFNIFFFCGSIALSIGLMWALPLPERYCVPIISYVYGGYVALIEKYIMGITYRVVGAEHLPKDGVYILAAKHQSAYETMKLPYIRALNYPAIILKKELTHIPVYGWYFKALGEIPVDRGAGADALNSMIRGCRGALDKGRPVIIFPQGTRVAVGDKKPYKVGLAKVYRDLKVPVVPVALNSGLFWGRNSFIKKPGVVTFEFLPPIPPGLPPLQMMEQLEKTVEEATDRLVAEAQAQGAA